MKNKILQYLLLLFTLPADILYLTGDTNLINTDLTRYLEEIPYRAPGARAFNYALIFIKPFRNIFYYRVQKSVIIKNISKMFIKPLATIEIMGEIGEGFRISHNYAVIHPHKAGKNLFAGHGVTVGKGTKANAGRVYPVIGDNVEIYSNAVVFGSIRIGNNVKIGAGAVVNKDVPDNCTVVGNPCRIIQK